MYIPHNNSAYYQRDWALSEYSREDGLRPLEATLVQQFFPPPRCSVLDIGCGAGRTTIGFVRNDYEVAGIDISEPLLRRAVGRYPGLHIYCMDATRLAFRDHSFDAAMFSYNGIDCVYPVSKRIE